jgi:hypothetical protein
VATVLSAVAAVLTVVVATVSLLVVATVLLLVVTAVLTVEAANLDEDGGGGNSFGTESGCNCGDGVCALTTTTAAQTNSTIKHGIVFMFYDVSHIRSFYTL